MTQDTTTQRARLLDLGADHMAQTWYELQFPQRYTSTRIVQGHEIAVIVCNGRDARKIMEYIEQDRPRLVRQFDEDDLIAD